MTQDDVAAALGCSRKWVSRFERGLTGPSFEMVVAYADLMGIGVYLDMEDGIVDLSRPSREIRKSK